jgi:hypothetical protein
MQSIVGSIATESSVDAQAQLCLETRCIGERRTETALGY